MISELRSYRGSRDPPQFVLHVMSLNTDTAIVSNRLPASPPTVTERTSFYREYIDRRVAAGDQNVF